MSAVWEIPTTLWNANKQTRITTEKPTKQTKTKQIEVTNHIGEQRAVRQIYKLFQHSVHHLISFNGNAQLVNMPHPTSILRVAHYNGPL